MVRLLRPTADITVDGWTRNDGSTTNLYQAIDEASASETDYIRSDGSQNPATYEGSFTGGSETGTNGGVTIRVREMKDSAGTETTDLDVIVATPTGWQVRTQAYDDIDQTINAVEFTLTADEMAEFRAHGGDFADMRVQVVRRKRPASVQTWSTVTYRTIGGETLTCNIKAPTAAGSYPCVIFIHGGGWVQGDADNGVLTWEKLATEEGFVVVSPNYRLAPPGGTSHAPAPMDDMSALKTWLVANAATYRINTAKFASVGGSAGAHLAACMATRGEVLCAVEASGPSSLDLMDDDGALTGPGDAYDRCLNFVGATEAADIAAWRAASPYYQVTSSTPPIFSLASSDDIIPEQQQQRLYAALVAAGVEAKLRVLTGTLHGIQIIDDAAVWPEVVTWLHRYLG